MNRMSRNNITYPVLYSSRKDPFAIRARMALYQAGYTIELREVNPVQPPEDILEYTDTGKIPILMPSERNIINDSLDIMDWALQRKDPEYWLAGSRTDMDSLIGNCDSEFKEIFECLLTSEDYTNEEIQAAKDRVLVIMDDLEDRLATQRYLFGMHLSLADVAIFPHIRQFKMLNSAYFDGLPHSRIHQWLTELSFHRAFEAVMGKFNIWKPGDPPVILAPWGNARN